MNVAYKNCPWENPNPPIVHGYAPLGQQEATKIISTRPCLLEKGHSGEHIDIDNVHFNSIKVFNP